MLLELFNAVVGDIKGDTSHLIEKFQNDYDTILPRFVVFFVIEKNQENV